MWIELSDGKENDWDTSFKICQRAFQNDSFYMYTHPDAEIRRKFLAVYYNDTYLGHLKEGYGLLSLLKVKEGNEIKIIGAIAGSYISGKELSKEDDDRLSQIDKESWERYKRHAEWEEQSYENEFGELGEKLGVTVIYGIFHAIADGYRGKGIGSKFLLKAMQMQSDEVMRREKLAGIPNSKMPFSYAISDHPKSRNFCKKIGMIELAQVRSYQPADLCKELSYMWIFVLPSLPLSYINAAKKIFVLPANL
uniref:uncharacterized protein LOC120338051 n=1 Tax=Styela clava TaxID=7725 RepID=UPI00193A041E|nr:uncharacterized protein LOC120338051 [Styela clava]